MMVYVSMSYYIKDNKLLKKLKIKRCLKNKHEKE